MSKTVPFSDLAANVDTLFEEVVQKHGEVVLTRDGKEVAKVVPLESVPVEDVRERRRRTLEELRGSVTILGDIVEPLEKWDCDE